MLMFCCACNSVLRNPAVCEFNVSFCPHCCGQKESSCTYFTYSGYASMFCSVCDSMFPSLISKHCFLQMCVAEWVS